MGPERLRKGLAVFAGAIVMLASLAIALTKARSAFNKRSPTVTTTRSDQMPQVVLWAWERPVDLRFINPREVGVAFLARTIQLREDDVVVRPRMQPLELPEGTRVIAVARVESSSKRRADPSNLPIDKLAAAIAEMAQLPNVSGIQIDFDAVRSERKFYRDVILAVRRRLPRGVSLSITALASWCSDDDWISDLPIDEAVPMLFRMGPDRQQIRNRLASGEEFPAQPCRNSYGISTDEPLRDLSTGKRLYVFNPDPWTENSVRTITDSRK